LEIHLNYIIFESSNLENTKLKTMKTKQYFLIGALGLALTGVMLTGCKKTTDNNPTDTTAAQDDATGADAIQDSKNISDGAAKGQAVDRFMAGSCETYRKFDTTINSQLDTAIDISFGNVDCVCLDGRKRRGHILVFWNGKTYFDPASVIEMTFKNYYLDDNGIAGTRTLTNTGANSWEFNAALTITYANSQTATWNSTRYYSLSTVNSVLYAVCTGPVTGYAASGTGRNGGTYNITITSALYVTAPWWLSFAFCPYIEAGAVTVNVSSFSYPIYVNFGSASALGSNDCHAGATATINGNNYSFNQ
jgi:hypothetical protein